MTISAAPSAPSLAAPSQDTVTATLMAAKKAKGMSFADLEAALGLDEVWIASLFYGQATASEQEAQKLADLLSLDPAITSALQEYPTKGSLDPDRSADLSLLRDHAGVWHASQGCHSRAVWGWHHECD